MQSIEAFEVKTHFLVLLERVEKGEEVVITKHGKAVARLSPFNSSETNIKEAIEKLKVFQSVHKLVLGLDWKLLRDEGRK